MVFLMITGVAPFTLTVYISIHLWMVNKLHMNKALNQLHIQLSVVNTEKKHKTSSYNVFVSKTVNNQLFLHWSNKNFIWVFAIWLVF